MLDYKNDMEKDVRTDLQMESTGAFIIKGDIEIIN